VDNRHLYLGGCKVEHSPTTAWKPRPKSATYSSGTGGRKGANAMALERGMIKREDVLWATCCFDRIKYGQWGEQLRKSEFNPEH